MATTISSDDRNPDVAATTPPVSRKKSILKKILLGFVAVIAVLAVVIAMQPSDFRVSRSATMAAPPAAIFAQVNDFHNWEEWSPWIKVDPNAKTSFEGPSAGKDAKFSWSGNIEVGEGSMTIVDSQPHERILIRLDFVKPFEGTSDAEFTFQPEGDQTNVTWSMAGTNNFMAKAISLVIDCEKMTGDYFEKGLASLKAIVEKSS
jgi:hypothetical protein